MLKNTRNQWGEPYEIRQNLTLNRRLLWNLINDKLEHFKFKWVRRGGDIFVRKNTNSKAIKIISERVIDDLLANHPPPKAPPSKEPSEKKHTNEINPPKSNRYADVVNNANYDSSLYRQNRVNFVPFSRPQLPHRSVNSAPLFRFRNTSFVNYRSPAF